MSRVSRANVVRWSITTLLVAAVAVAVIVMLRLEPPGAASKDQSHGIVPAKVEAVAGQTVKKVTLTAEAAKRLDVQTATIKDGQIGGKPKLIMPAAAVVYDASGATWAYTNAEPLVYLRKAITVESIQGDQAFLSAGPPVGTTVVTVGASELYGTELGVGGKK
jgi:hypothetical protein